MKKGKPKSYDTAFEELQKIMQQVQSGDIGLEQMTDQLKRAGILIAFCRERLRKLESEVEKLFESDTPDST